MSGRIPIGHIPPFEVFERVIILDGDGHYVQLPSLTTVQRNALTAVNGIRIYNITTNQCEVYDNGAWRADGQIAVNTHAAILDAHTKNIHEVIRTGQYYMSILNSQQSAGVVADRLYTGIFVIARDMSFDRIAIQVSALADPSNIRLGIYNDGINLHPGTLVRDCGVVSGATTGVKPITLDPVVSLTKGIFHLAFISDATPSVYSYSSDVYSSSPLGLAAEMRYNANGWYLGSAYGPLSDPCPAMSGVYGAIPLIALRVYSLD